MPQPTAGPVPTISSTEISVKFDGSGGGRTSYTFFPPFQEGALVQNDKVVLAFPEVTGNQAVMQIDG